MIGLVDYPYQSTDAFSILQFDLSGFDFNPTLYILFHFMVGLLWSAEY